MKLSSVVPVALVCGAVCAAPEEQSVQERNVENPETARAGSGTCSIGIGRPAGSILWDVTVYNVPQLQRQDENVIATLKNTAMDKGKSITIKSPASDITISNVDNAPVFDYNIPDLHGPLTAAGNTKVQLAFSIPGLKLNFTTADCGPGSVIFSAGRESWSCDFPCTISKGKEL